jgi:hypothetical protein
MCIISGAVKNVSNTKIFVAPLASDQKTTVEDLTTSQKTCTRQLTVYCNKVSVVDKSAVMVLPFPKSTYESFDLTEYPTLFVDLHRICWPQPKSKSRSLNSLSDGDSYSNSLKVFSNGSFLVSVVPDLADFSRLQGQVFEIRPAVIEFMKNQYPSDYSFVVCKLDGDKEYHPFGYIHDTLPGGAMFIPTMHYHTHEKEQDKEDSEEDDESNSENKKWYKDYFERKRFSSGGAPFDNSTYNSTHASEKDMEKYKLAAAASEKRTLTSDEEAKVKQILSDPNFMEQYLKEENEARKGRLRKGRLHATKNSASDKKEHDNKEHDNKEDITADWNHEIYCWNRPLAHTPLGFQFSQKKFRPHFVELVYLPENLEAADTVFAYKIVNYKQNHDLVCAASVF